MLNNEQERLLSIAREYYGRVAWTHKTYEKDCELLSKTTWRNKWINIIILSITSTGILVSIPLDALWIKIVGAIGALLSTGLAIYQLSFTPEIEALRYRTAAKKLLIERDKLLLVIDKAMSPQADIKNLRDELDDVICRIGEVYAGSPDTTSKAFQLASNGLNQKEELTFSKDELNNILPEKLRIP